MVVMDFEGTVRETAGALIPRDDRILEAMVGTDPQYRNDYPHIPYRNDKLTDDYSFASDAKQRVNELAVEIGNKIIAADLVRRQDLQGQR